MLAGTHRGKTILGGLKHRESVKTIELISGAPPDLFIAFSEGVY